METASFGARLEAAMFRRGLVQDDLARMFAVNQSTVSGWVNGSSLPHPSRAQALAEFMEVPRADVLGWWADDAARRVSDRRLVSRARPTGGDDGTPATRAAGPASAPGPPPLLDPQAVATIEQRLSNLERVVEWLVAGGSAGQPYPSNLEPSASPQSPAPIPQSDPEELTQP